MDDCNNYMCWECDEECEIKSFFEYPDVFFYKYLEEVANTYGGRIMASGHSAEFAKRQRGILVATLITSRMKYLEKMQKG